MSGEAPSNAAAKEQLRREMIARLSAITPDEGARASLAACDGLRAELADRDAAGVVLSFAPIRRGPAGDEIDLSALHHTLLEAGRLALPRLNWETRAMEAMVLPKAAALDEGTMLEVRRHGVPEPAAGEVVSPEALSAILVPGLAFDLRGGRLGRGGGFYDRYLDRLEPRGEAASRPTLIGVCFGVQLVERVPLEAHDHRVDRLVTESARLVCDE